VSKRGPHEGTISRRKNGLWQGALHLGYRDGKRLRKHFYARTRAEVVEKMALARADQLKGIALRTDERQTVGDYLTRWLANVEPKLRPRTHRGYALIVRRHLLPTLGRMQLTRLSRDDVRALLIAKRRDGLSAQTIHNVHAVLRHALEQAVTDDLLSRNVAAGVDLPRIERPEVAALSHEDALRIIAAVREDRIGPAVIVSMTTGLRQGELLGLRWEDVDWTERQLRVSRSLVRFDGQVLDGPTKTRTSRRVVPLTQLAIDELQRQRERQRFDERWAGSRWQASGYIFTSSIGTPAMAGDLTKRFQRLLADAGLPRMRWHDLRHAAASMLLAQGEHPKVVQELLGHSSIQVTMGVYSHVIPSLKRDAADRMDELLRVGG
jgi:integrase